MLASAICLVFPIAMAFAAANDLFTMRIPNAISGVLIAGFAVAGLLSGMTWQDYGLHFAVGTAALAATFALFAFNLFGGGDAKLLAAGALWMGPEHILAFLVYTALFGGVLSVVVLSYRRFIPAGAFEMPDWAARLHSPGGAIPYGIAIAASALFVFPQTEIFRLAGM